MGMKNSVWLAAIPSTWLASILASLPHLLYALSKYVPGFLMRANLNEFNALADWIFQFVQRLPPAWWLLTSLAPAGYWGASRVFVEVWSWAFVIFVLILVLVAWRSGWPRWSATTLGYVLIVLFETSLMIWRDDRSTSFSAGVVLIGYICLIVWLSRRDPLAGLLALLPLYPMFVWLTAMDGVRGIYGEGVFYIVIGLVMAFVVGAAMRRGSLAFGLGLLVIVILALGLGVGYATVYFSNMAAPPQPTPGAVLRSGLGALIALTLIGLPLWLTLGWGWARRRSVAA
jgi:hypothetical protein